MQHQTNHLLVIQTEIITKNKICAKQKMELYSFLKKEDNKQNVVVGQLDGRVPETRMEVVESLTSHWTRMALVWLL